MKEPRKKFSLIRFLKNRALGFAIMVPGLATGWWLRQWTAPATLSESAAIAHQASAAAGRRGQTRPPGRKSSDSVTSGLISEIASLDHPSQSMLRLRAALDRGEVKDFATLARALADAPLSSFNKDGLRQVLLAWAARDPAAALDFLDKEKRRGRVSELKDGLGGSMDERLRVNWAARDPDAAAAYLKAHYDDPVLRSNGLGLWMKGALSQGDAAGHLGKLLGTFSEREIQDTLNGQSGNWRLRSSPDEMRELATRIHLRGFADSIAEMAMNRYLDEQPKRTPDQALAWLREKSPADGEGSLRLKIMFSSRWEPSDLARQLTSADATDLRSSEAQDALRHLALAGPKLAFDLLVQRPDLPFGNYEISQIGKRLTGKTPDEITAYLQKIADPIRRQELVAGLVSMWDYRRPVTELLARAQTLGPEADAATTDILLSRVGRTGVSATAPVTDFQSMPPEFQDRLRPQFAVKISERDAMQAAALLQSGGADGLATQNGAIAAEQVAENFMHQNSIQASAWVGSLPPGLGRDHAVLALVRSVVGKDAEAAAQWSAFIEDQDVHAAALAALTEKTASKHR